MDFDLQDVEDWMRADESNDSRPPEPGGGNAAAIDVHSHAMPLPLLEWFERTRLSASNTGPRRP